MRSWCSSGLRRACAAACELPGITQLRWANCAPGAEVVGWLRFCTDAFALALAADSVERTRPSGSSWLGGAAHTLALRGLSGVALLPMPLAALEARAEEAPVEEDAPAAALATGVNLSRLALRAGVAC